MMKKENKTKVRKLTQTEKVTIKAMSKFLNDEMTKIFEIADKFSESLGIPKSENLSVLDWEPERMNWFIERVEEYYKKNNILVEEQKAEPKAKPRAERVGGRE